MKITKIKLNNFRQFFGSQVLDLSTDAERNVTLIRADNGVGKTTLLNAIYWCFYEETTKNFEGKDKIINFEAAKEHATAAEVEVTIEHDSKIYRIQRIFRSSKNRSEKQSFNVFEIDKGLNRAIPNPVAFINSVIPKDMAPYFFFDGEHAEKFSSEDHSENVGDAIRNILGCNLLDNAVADLRWSSSKLGRIIAEIPGQEVLGTIEDRLEKLNEEITSLQRQKRDQEDNVRFARSQLEVLHKKYESLKEAREIAARRAEQEKRLDGLERERESLQKETAKWIRDSAWLFFSASSLEKVTEFLKAEATAGRIPSPYNEEFVRQILDERVCICGAHLVPGSDQFLRVAKLTDHAGNADVQRKVVGVLGMGRTLQQRRESAREAKFALDSRMQNISTGIRECQQRIAEATQRLEGLNQQEIRDIEKARVEMQRKADVALTEIGTINAALGQADVMKGNLQQSRDKIAGESARARPILARIQLADAGANVLKTLSEQHEEVARRRIESIINQILENTARREYSVHIEKDFSLKMLFTGIESPKSGGENQLLSLAFISALIRFAEERQSAPKAGLFIPGTVAPLVLDSPFGQLDPHYRKSTAKFVPQLSKQVILLVSGSQGTDSVLETLLPRVGRQYVLVAHNKSTQGAKTAEYIDIDGEHIPTTLFNSDRNYTEIREIA